MGDESCRIICDLVSKIGSLLIINLCKNNITCQGAEYISQIIRRRDLKVRAILLNWNKIMGKGSIQLAMAIEDNQTLQIFDCSFNSFGSGQLKVRGGTYANKLLNAAPAPTGLMKSPEGILQSINYDPFDELADYEGYTISAMKWAKALITNKTLVHLDLSFNNLKTPDIKVIGEGLKLNHTLLGIHLMGNEAKIDELGFVTPEKTLDSASFHVFTRIP